MTRLFFLLLVGALAGLPLAAADAQMTGYISDSFCGQGNANDSAESKECAQRCVNNGADPVFVEASSGKLFQFTDSAKARPLVGEKVVVKGSVEKGKLSISTIAKAPKS